MSRLPLDPLTPDTAPEPAASTLKKTQEGYGFLPNLYTYFAHAPGLLQGYLSLSKLLAEGTLNATERNVVMLAASRENECLYCVAVHSTIADMQKDDSAITDAIRSGAPIADAKLEALRRLTQALVRDHKNSDAEVEAFLNAGYEAHQVLEVVLGVGMKTLSNITNHLVQTPLDTAFQARKWPD
jgi:uncharacterized peroxidase-related enzyme